jgi:hypothetical protein
MNFDFIHAGPKWSGVLLFVFAKLQGTTGQLKSFLRTCSKFAAVEKPKRRELLSPQPQQPRSNTPLNMNLEVQCILDPKIGLPGTFMTEEALSMSLTKRSLCNPRPLPPPNQQASSDLTQSAQSYLHSEQQVKVDHTRPW